MVSIVEMVRQALRSLGRHPLRSALTLLGFAIGVGAFVAMVTFAAGARRAVVAQFESLGTGTLVVTAGGGAGDPAVRAFSTVDARRLASDVDGVAAVAPMARRMLPVSTGERRASTLVVGTTPDFVRIRAWDLSSGVMFDRDDLVLGNRVCVPGQTVIDRLFDGTDPVGRRLRVGDVDCRVVGALAPLGQTASGQDQDDTVLLPLPLFERRIAGRAGADRLLVGLAPEADRARAREAVVGGLRALRQLDPDDPSDFTIKSPDDLIRVADQTAGLLQALLGAVAAVSLLVGGIGIMNILLVSVGERTAEIGVRAAVGATPGQILAQFLVEAMALSGLGALIGAAAGGALSIAVADRLHWAPELPLALAGAAVAGGVALGLLFGLYPARRAAQLDPVVALRSS